MIPFFPFGSSVHSFELVNLPSIVSINPSHILQIYSLFNSIQLNSLGGLPTSCWGPNHHCKMSQWNSLGVISQLGSKNELRQDNRLVQGSSLLLELLILFNNKPFPFAWILTLWYPHFFYLGSFL